MSLDVKQLQPEIPKGVASFGTTRKSEQITRQSYLKRIPHLELIMSVTFTLIKVILNLLI